jgi:hypothetical protein
MKMDINKTHRKRSLFISLHTLIKINFVMVIIITLIGGVILSPSLLSQSRMSAYGISATNASTVASAAAAAATAAGAKQDGAAAGAGAAAAAAASGESVPNIATAAASAITSHGGSKAAATAAAAAAAAAAAGAKPQDAAAAGAAAAAGNPSADVSAAAGGGVAGAAAAAAVGAAMNAGVKSTPTSSVPQNTTAQEAPAAPLTQQAPQPQLSQQPPTQPPAAPLTQQAPQPQLSQGIPGLLPPDQQQQKQAPQPPSTTSTPVPVEGLTANGTINSLIYAPATKWIATGNWSMAVRNGNVSSFNTNMTWYNNNGTGTHSHQLNNFRATEGKVAIKPDNSLSLKGTMDVGTNNRIVWKNVHATIDIKGGKTFSTSVNDNETNHHFAGQTIYGVVTSLKRCSDQPGPNMEVLPPCT